MIFQMEGKEDINNEEREEKVKKTESRRLVSSLILCSFQSEIYGHL